MQRKYYFHAESFSVFGLGECSAHGGDQLLAGLQADSVAFNRALGGIDRVGDGDGEGLPVAGLGDADGTGCVGVFSDIGEEIVKDPPEMAQIHQKLAMDLALTAPAGLHPGAQ